MDDAALCFFMYIFGYTVRIALPITVTPQPIWRRQSPSVHSQYGGANHRQSTANKSPWLIMQFLMLKYSNHIVRKYFVIIMHLWKFSSK